MGTEQRSCCWTSPCCCAAAEWPCVGGSSCPVSVQPTGCSHCSGYRSGKWVFVTHFGLSLHPSPTHTSSDLHTDHGSVPDIPFPTGTDADRQGSNCLIDPKVFFGRDKFMRKYSCCRSDIFVFWLVIIDSCWVLTSYQFWPNSVWDGARKERGRTVSQSKFNNEQIRWWLSPTTTPARSSHQPTSCVHGHTHTQATMRHFHHLTPNASLHTQECFTVWHWAAASYINTTGYNDKLNR